jgi:DNA-binding NtrC family response regulator
MSRDDRDGGPTEQLVAPTAAPRRLRLVVASGPDRGRSLLLAPGTHRVGKSRSCELVLADGAVSGQHLALEVSDAGVVVRDLGSTNGSWFGGARFTLLEVDRAATLTIGKTELRIEPVDATTALEPSPRDRFGGLLGTTEPMRRLFTLLERVAGTDATVLIEGETGTGKELVARGLHDAGNRWRNGPFVVCDLAVVTAPLIESELFGHVRGAFTGADRDRTGAFEAALHGTIFLDEIGELPLELQPRLLRALEGREIRPVGASSYRAIDVRVIAATNRDLASEVRAGRFREDLYHRLGVVTARVPSLRERAADIPMLVRHFLAGTGVAEPDAATMAALVTHDWPGNVRELRNVIERAVALGVGLTAALGVGPAPAGGRAAPPVDPSVPFKEAKGQLIDAWERDYVTALLAACDGNVSLAARRAGMDRAYLHRVLKKHGIGHL